MIYVLIWLLIGSLSLNYLWIQNHKLVMEEFKNKPSNYDYLKGILLSIVAGPFTLPVKIFVDKSLEKAEREYEEELRAAIKRKRGMAQEMKQ